MAVHVETYLSRQLRQTKTSAPMLVAQTYLAIMAWQPNRAQKVLDQFRDFTKHVLGWNAAGIIAVRAC